MQMCMLADSTSNTGGSPHLFNIVCGLCRGLQENQTMLLGKLLSLLCCHSTAMLHVSMTPLRAAHNTAVRIPVCIKTFFSVKQIRPYMPRNACNA